MKKCIRIMDLAMLIPAAVAVFLINLATISGIAGMHLRRMWRANRKLRVADVYISKGVGVPEVPQTNPFHGL